MRAPLSVRINDGRTNRLVTQYVDGLSFTKSAPGGHESASMRLRVPRDMFRDLGPADKVTVYDTRTSAKVWEGYTENPGAEEGAGGEAFDLRAMGGVILASDESRSLVYIDRDLQHWFRADDFIAASARTDRSTDPTGVQSDGLLCQFNPGQPIDTDYRARMVYHGLDLAGMEFGGLRVSCKAGKVDANYRLRFVHNAGSEPMMSSTQITTTEVDSVYRVITHAPSGTNRIGVELIRTGGATNVADDNTWGFFYDIAVRCRRMLRDGTLHPESINNSNGYILASEVAEDLLGRVLANVCDTDAALIEASTYQIDQLAYHDGATARRVFEDLSLYEPDMLWEILESTPSGKHRFQYRAWPTTPRYEITTADGYEATGGEVDLCNRIAVYWTDERGRKQTTVRTATVEELGSRTRDAEAVTLPDGLGSLANAQRIGDQILELKNNPGTSARASVSRPVMDHLRGMKVLPHEIEPGYVVRVRETGEDLRLTETTYDDDAGATSLTLGTPLPNFEQMLAGLR